MSHRSVLITGAASGIGAACARRLAGPGVSLFLTTRSNGDALASVASEAEASGANVKSSLIDLSERGAGAQLIEDAFSAFGSLDQIVANAGFATKGGVGSVDRDELDRAHAAMTGAFYDLSRAAMAPLQASECGAIVAVSSFVAHVFDRGAPFAVSAAAKGALEALVKSLAAELAGNGVTVNAAAPGYTKKDASGHSALGSEAWQRAAERTPAGRIADPDDIAALVEFLVGPGARHITGQVIHVDGGLSLGT